MKRNLLISGILLLSPLLTGQSLPDSNGQSVPDSLAVPEISWQCKAIARGVLLRSAETQLFNSSQAIYIVDIDTSMSDFEFGVAGADSTLICTEGRGACGNQRNILQYCGTVQCPLRQDG